MSVCPCNALLYNLLYIGVSHRCCVVNPSESSLNRPKTPYDWALYLPESVGKYPDFDRPTDRPTIIFGFQRFSKLTVQLDRPSDRPTPKPSISALLRVRPVREGISGCLNTFLNG